MELNKTTLNQIVDTKQDNKRKLGELKNSYLLAIYKGLSNGESIEKIRKHLIDMTLSKRKKGEIIDERMLKSAIGITNSIKRKLDTPNFVKNYQESHNEPLGIALSMLVFSMINKGKVEQRLSHNITTTLNTRESEDKEEAISKTLQENRSEIQKNKDNQLQAKIFYLASKHSDSAEDHKDYQGKMYIDENWKNYIDDNGIRLAVEHYISLHDVKTFQWVIGKPVYFITRPNCRHFFKPLSIKEVLSDSARDLRKKYNMNLAIGNREYLQTLNYSDDKQIAIRNAEILLDKYKERLKVHKQMDKTNPNPLIKSAIDKDNLLIKKWSEYLVKNKK